MSGPRQQLCLRGEQLLVERREERVSSEWVTLTEPAQLLHVQTAQWTQHCHPLVQLQGGHRHIQTFFYYSEEHAGQKNFLLFNQLEPIRGLKRKYLLYAETCTLCIRLSWLSRCRMCVSPNSTLLCTRWTLPLSSRHGRSAQKDKKKKRSKEGFISTSP